MPAENIKLNKLSSLLPTDAVKQFQLSGEELLEEIGEVNIRKIVASVLCGQNIRESTEVITRRNLAQGNAALLILLLKGNQLHDDFFETSLDIALKQLPLRGLGKVDRWVLYWLLGLTDKGKQNVLRDEYRWLGQYRTMYDETVSKVAEAYEKEYGSLKGSIQLKGFDEFHLNWNTLVKLMAIVGSQTLTLRGSQKSLLGKLFEKLILTSALYIQGFRFIKQGSTPYTEEVFWLSSHEDDRESDATAIYKDGKGLVFDMGFIGRGNSEISGDKVFRFSRQIEFKYRKIDLNTVVLIDKLGKKSNLPKLARKYDGHIVQMCQKDWMKQIAKIIFERFGKKLPLLDMDISQLHTHIEKEMKTVQIYAFLSKKKA